MRLPSQAIALTLVLQAPPIEAWKITDGLRINAYEPYAEPDQIIVPSYNISLPIDHFTPSDTRTFNNRYFVNDTYYKPGGPVIFFDFGESGVDDWTAAVFMAGWNGSLSAPLELAKARGGVVVGWEHRYYGYSRPFPVAEADEYDDEGYSYSSSSGSAGIPLGGAAEYEYLTVAQALEDVAYFAARFNQTVLGGRNTVLAGENATQHLGPWDTPWIWVGGSYPGMRGTWMRLRNPDVIYAVWASSAPVQTVPDGSAYPNSIYRALPKNCTADMHAAVSRIDQILDGGNSTEMNRLATQITLAFESVDESYYVKTRSSVSSDPYDYQLDDFKPVLSTLFLALVSTAQGGGYTTRLQQFCDVMETFDVPSFLANSSAASDTVFLWNEGDAPPSDKGIAASNSDNRGPEAALAAYLYAVNRYFNGGPSSYSKRKRSSSSYSYYDSITPQQDAHSWEWQVLSEMGLILSANGSSPYALGSKYVDHAYSHSDIINSYFANFSGADIPAEPDNSYPMGFGGWRMTPSNTMFTNGEFDPWRAYGVASLEAELPDYPAFSSMTQDVPQCNSADYLGGHFGLVYPGGVHAEDMFSGLGETRGSQNTTDPPLKQGLELFLKALDVWLPCFNSSRGQTAAVDPNQPTGAGNSTGNSTGPGDKSGAMSGRSVAGGVWAVVGVFSVVIYLAL
ncbi:hypothetical protein CONLIGDRAFT_682867 [Coniochaeta ligniaria NRRL 30616]|uniref:Peptidase S28 n=1 Tax=Coniochaeta ligniaria NRRL 30616 TaxID=1408157 RepID=A0A1J7IK49_9PEZI|nr:hypothetical protein CONLIGDRAFT_682867 [Coniochaeta ligniaria NRRL 30616]